MVREGTGEVSVRIAPHILSVEQKKSEGAGADQETLLARILQSQACGAHAHPTVQYR